MKFFIIKLFATILIFTQLPVSAMLVENESEDESGRIAIFVDTESFQQCTTLYTYEECLNSAAYKIRADIIKGCIIDNNKKTCVSMFGSNKFIEHIVSIVETLVSPFYELN